MEWKQNANSPAKDRIIDATHRRMSDIACQSEMVLEGSTLINSED